MLRKFDYFEVNHFHTDSKNKFWSAENYYLNSVCHFLGIQNGQEIESALSRVHEACRSLRIPFEENFQKVFLHDDEKIFSDWKISKLGLYLFLINSNTSNPKVAHVQLYFFKL